MKLKSLEGTEEAEVPEASVELDLALTAEEEVKQFHEAAQHLMERVRGRGAATSGQYDVYLSTQAVRTKKTQQKQKRHEGHRAANKENFEELQKRLKVASRRQVLSNERMCRTRRDVSVSAASMRARLRACVCGW